MATDMQMRDYQYVGDHCEGIDVVLHNGALGEVYNVGTGVETHNIDMARKILACLVSPRACSNMCRIALATIGDTRSTPASSRRWAGAAATRSTRRWS